MLSDVPNFRSLELYRPIMIQSFPHWHATLQNPVHGFPNTVKFIQEEMVDKGLHELAEMKLAQLKEGIAAAYEEMAKMYEAFFCAPWIFTLFTCAEQGATNFRVVLNLLHEKGVDLDHNVEGNDNNFAQMDDSLEWGYAMHPPEVPSPLYNAFYQKLKEQKEGLLTQYFQMFGFLNNRCRNDLKQFSNERSITRNPASQTALIDFAKEYPEIFDCLWAIFALQPSNSQPSEQFNGMECHAHYNQTRLGHLDARGRYMMLREYFRRKAVKNDPYSMQRTKASPVKRAPKHNDRKDTVTMSGE